MTTQLIHIVGPECEARHWLVDTIVRGLRGAGHAGALLEVVAEHKSNDELRNFPILGRVALVIADARRPRHDDLAGTDLVITLDVGREALDPAMRDAGAHGPCGFIISAARHTV